MVVMSSISAIVNKMLSSDRQFILDDEPTFSVSPNPLYSFILLAITATALLLSIIAIFIDMISNRQPNKSSSSIHRHHNSVDSPATFVRNYDQPNNNNNNNNDSTSTQTNTVRFVTDNDMPSLPSSSNQNNQTPPNSSSPLPNPAVPSPPSVPTIAPATTATTATTDGNDNSNDNSGNINHVDSSGLPDLNKEVEQETKKLEKKIEKKQKIKKSEKQKAAIRSLICTILSRLLFCSLSLGTIALSIYLFIPILRKGPLFILADDETNQWIYKLLKRSLLQYSILSNQPFKNSTILGLGSDLLEPNDTNTNHISMSWTWLLLYIVILIYVIVGVFIRLSKGFIPTSNYVVAIFTLVQLVIWIIISLTATFIYPSKLPLHSTPLKNIWIDYVYEFNETNNNNEQKLLSNFYVSMVGDDNKRVKLNVGQDLEKFQNPFCSQFTELTPTSVVEYVPSEDELFPTVPPTPSPLDDSEEIDDEELVLISPGPGPQDVESNALESLQSSLISFLFKRQRQEYKGFNPSSPFSATSTRNERQVTSASPDSIDIERLPLDLYNQIFLVYGIGKTMGVDQFHILGYMALPIMIIGPITAAHLIRIRYFLGYPFVLLWIIIVMILSLLGTPSTLRTINIANEGKQIYSFCNLNYRVRILDNDSILITRIDFAIFVITICITIFEIIRWFRESDYVSYRRSAGGTDKGNYDQVAGPLRW